MKKLGLLFREISEKRIKNSLKSSNGVFILNYSGLSSLDLSTLRRSLKDSGGMLFVTKNTIAKRALKDEGLDTLVKSIEGPCGLVFIKEEPVSVSRVLCNFYKEHQQLKLEGGFLEDRILERKDIESIAYLPTREVLRAQVVFSLKSPISGIVMVLNQTLRKFVYCLSQIKNKRGGENG